MAAGASRRAAVLIPFVATPTGVELLFILRPQHMSSHPGQVAFPGGAVDAGDATTWETALRETREELGVPSGRVQRLGRVDDLLTLSGFHIAPWAGLIAPDTPLSPHTGEVAAVFTVPLTRLLDPRHQRTMLGRWRQRTHRMRFYLAEEHVIWGVTSQILGDLLAVIAGRRGAPSRHSIESSSA